ncbi:hypothetical protein SARC_12634 [Sphaeroforma arctica JP610]|uniref:Alpha-ketoglutarate-dependent dioxygenase FTO catalytic domain-containing protein n=1 Tax=Sphaeroforma arctica JP610 TaxID=667725 RepID=A0A0L0FEB2_9EUKA|nr:hypothetical protein SARC_12634 [Sphaeroforma arctica JP610]KNC74826.1 hypothetical protein SARC_12634 [Sphaeroforma arctica JP610]|eukprot:XP_014148728.1 hypothetical protein SARC_12634 [Sphaeroforma arctica JP610]
MTYHYQRLRIFALPWDDDGTGVYQADTAKCESGRPVSNLLALKQLNSTLTTNATELLLQYHKEGGDKHNQQIAQKGVVPRGSCKYSVSLINYMFCEKDSKVPLKNEAVYGMGPTSVSWHADSSLQNYSTIAVYQITGNGPIAGSQNQTKRSSKTSDTTKGSEDDWSVAMRVVADDVTPAVACRLKSGETYYMMDDFNHHHHHAGMQHSNGT